jgi:hypothetical protein
VHDLVALLGNVSFGLQKVAKQFVGEDTHKDLKGIHEQIEDCQRTVQAISRMSTGRSFDKKVPRRKLWVVLGNIESDVAAAVGSNDVAGFGRWSLTGRQDQFCLGHGDRRQALHLAAHRFAAAGLDRDTHGREFCIGAINDAIGSSPRWSGERFGGG